MVIGKRRTSVVGKRPDCEGGNCHIKSVIDSEPSLDSRVVIYLLISYTPCIWVTS